MRPGVDREGFGFVGFDRGFPPCRGFDAGEGHVDLLVRLIEPPRLFVGLLAFAQLVDDRRPLVHGRFGPHPGLQGEPFGQVEFGRVRDLHHVVFPVEAQGVAVLPPDPFGPFDRRGVAVAGHVFCGRPFPFVEGPGGDRTVPRRPDRRAHVGADFGRAEGSVVDADLVDPAFEPVAEAGVGADLEFAAADPRRVGEGARDQSPVDVEARHGAVPGQGQVRPGFRGDRFGCFDRLFEAGRLFDTRPGPVVLVTGHVEPPELFGGIGALL